MTQFIVIAIVMVAIGLAWVLPPLLRRSATTADVNRAAFNLDILKTQLADLETEHRRGAIPVAHYAEAKAELERRVLEEVQAAPAEAKVRPSWHGRVTAAAVMVTIPIASALLYAKYGDPAAFDPLARKGADTSHQMSEAEIAQMVASLEERLKKEPDNANGWSTLARTYYFQRKFPEAAAAFKKLAELVPNEAAVFADYADALAMANGRKIAGEPLALVKKALALDPRQWKALAMAGTEAFERKDYKTAVEYWERLRESLPAESPIAQQIASSITEARELAGIKPSMAVGAPNGEAKAEAKGAAASVAAANAQSATKAAGGREAPLEVNAQISGLVSLSPQIAAKAAPEDAVFVFARAAEGPRMPLAIVRLQVKDLPAKFVLNDSMAMSPGMKLSNFGEVIVGARVAKSGGANAKAGDLEGLSKPVKTGSRDINVTIDSVVK